MSVIVWRALSMALGLFLSVACAHSLPSNAYNSSHSVTPSSFFADAPSQLLPHIANGGVVPSQYSDENVVNKSGDNDTLNYDVDDGDEGILDIKFDDHESSSGNGSSCRTDPSMVVDEAVTYTGVFGQAHNIPAIDLSKPRNFTIGYLTGSARLPDDQEYKRPGLLISGALTLAVNEVRDHFRFNYITL